MHLKPNTPILQYSNTPFAGFAQSWTFDPWIIIPLLLASSIYLRGWRQLHRRLPRRFAVWRLIAFQAGLLTLFLALASPLHPLAELLLQFHMIQHLLLMMVVPPLLFSAPHSCHCCADCRGPCCSMGSACCSPLGRFSDWVSFLHPSDRLFGCVHSE